MTLIRRVQKHYSVQEKVANAARYGLLKITDWRMSNCLWLSKMTIKRKHSNITICSMT